MNKKLIIKKGHKASLLATGIFVALGLALGFLMFYYWSYNVEPRLRREAVVQAKFLAQAQSNILTSVLSAGEGVDSDSLADAMDHILLFSDPESDSQIIESIELELDYDVLNAEKGTLDLKRGDVDCNDCFDIEIPLISTDSYELVGIAHFAVSTKFFRTLSNDIMNKLILEAAIALLLLTMVWIAVLFLIKQLQTQIEERERAEAKIQAYAVKLEESNQELDAFAHTASHDLQEPLRKINAYSDLLEEEYGHLVDEEGKQYIHSMQGAATRMQKLITAILRYSRITTKGKPFSPVDLNLIMQEVIDDLHVRIKETEGKIEYKGLPTIDADPVQIRQLLFNLVGNSLKYCKDNVAPVVKVRAKVESSGSGSTKWSQCHLTVEDNGIGFDQKYSEKIFVIFQRLHGRSEYEGMGIGLALCFKIAKRHSGTILATGRPGAGAKFEVILPAKQIEEGAYV